MTLSILDSGGVIRQLSTTVNANDGGLCGTHTLIDPVSSIRQNINAFGQAAITSDGTKPTYRYAGLFTLAANPTDVIVIPGSATKTVRVKSIILTGLASASGINNVFLSRRSSAPSGGTAVGLTAFKHDNSNDPSATIVPTIYTANPTVGTLVATGGARSLYWSSGLGPESVEWDFCQHEDKAVILRGVSDFLCVSFVGAAVETAAQLLFEIEIEEDNS